MFVPNKRNQKQKNMGIALIKRKAPKGIGAPEAFYFTSEKPRELWKMI